MLKVRPEVPEPWEPQAGLERLATQGRLETPERPGHKVIQVQRVRLELPERLEILARPEGSEQRVPWAHQESLGQPESQVQPGPLAILARPEGLEPRVTVEQQAVLVQPEPQETLA